MAKAQKSKGRWKCDVNYISHVVSDISQKMDHIVKELREASFSLEHMADAYPMHSKYSKKSNYHGEYFGEY